MAEAKRSAPGILSRHLTSSAEAADTNNPTAPQGAAFAPTVPLVQLSSGITFEKAFEKGLRERAKWLQSKDKKALRSTFDAIADYWGKDTPLAKAERAGVLEWRAKMLAAPGKRPGTTTQPSTINHRLSMLSVLLEVADLPPHGVKHLSVKGNERIRRITDKELRAVKDWLVANAHHRGAVSMAQLITLGFETAARLSELLGMQWADLGEGTATFHKTKNGRSRTVPLTVAARRVLEARSAFKTAPWQDLDEFRAVDLWAMARKGIGLEGDQQFVFHLLRHERLTRLAERNVNALLLQKLAGHEQVTTTQRYVHAGTEALAAAMGIEPTAPADEVAQLEESVNS
jgi:integrase